MHVFLQVVHALTGIHIGLLSVSYYHHLCLCNMTKVCSSSLKQFQNLFRPVGEKKAGVGIYLSSLFY